VKRILLLLIAIAGCVPPGFAPGEPETGRADQPPANARPALSDARLRLDIVAEANDARRAAHVYELVEDEALAAAASEYALELARKRRLSHQSDTPGRRTMAERIQGSGATDWIAADENLAAVHETDRRLVETVVQGWLDSPGHRRNRLNGEYRRSGTGVARATDGYWYVVQLYVQPVRRAAR